MLGSAIRSELVIRLSDDDERKLDNNIVSDRTRLNAVPTAQLELVRAAKVYANARDRAA